MTSFTDPSEASRRGKLELNARGHHYDPLLEKWADLFTTDVEAWSKLSVLQQDRASLYLDFRQHYRDAVAAGAVVDDRGPGSEKEATSW